LIVNFSLGNVGLLLFMLYAFNKKDFAFPLVLFIVFNLAALLLLPRGIRAIKRTWSGRARAGWGFLISVLVFYLGVLLCSLVLMPSWGKNIALLSQGEIAAVGMDILKSAISSIVILLGGYPLLLPMAAVNMVLFTFLLPGREETAQSQA